MAPSTCKPLSRLGVIVATMAFAGGVGGPAPWSQYGANSKLSGSGPAASAAMPRRNWTLPLTPSGPPVVGADGTLFVSSLNALYAIDPVSSSTKWQYTLGDSTSFVASPALSADGSSVYAAQNYGWIYSIYAGTGGYSGNSEGSLTGGAAGWNPSVDAKTGLIYVAGPTAFCAVNGLDASPVCYHAYDPTISATTVATSNDGLFVYINLGTSLHAVRASSCKLYWTVSPESSEEVFVGVPAVGPDGTIFVASYVASTGSHYITAFYKIVSSGSSQMIWSREFTSGEYAPPLGISLHSNSSSQSSITTIFAASTITLSAFQWYTGSSSFPTLLWQSQASTILSKPSVSSDGVVVIACLLDGRTDASILALSAAGDGNGNAVIVWELDTGDQMIADMVVLGLARRLFYVAVNNDQYSLVAYAGSAVPWPSASPTPRPSRSPSRTPTPFPPAPPEPSNSTSSSAGMSPVEWGASVVLLLAISWFLHRRRRQQQAARERADSHSSGSSNGSCEQVCPAHSINASIPGGDGGYAYAPLASDASAARNGAIGAVPPISNGDPIVYGKAASSTKLQDASAVNRFLNGPAPPAHAAARPAPSAPAVIEPAVASGAMSSQASTPALHVSPLAPEAVRPVRNDPVTRPQGPPGNLVQYRAVPPPRDATRVPRPARPAARPVPRAPAPAVPATAPPAAFDPEDPQ